MHHFVHQLFSNCDPLWCTVGFKSQLPAVVKNDAMSEHHQLEETVSYEAGALTESDKWGNNTVRRESHWPSIITSVLSELQLWVLVAEHVSLVMKPFITLLPSPLSQTHTFNSMEKQWCCIIFTFSSVIHQDLIRPLNKKWISFLFLHVSSLWMFTGFEAAFNTTELRI